MQDALKKSIHEIAWTTRCATSGTTTTRTLWVHRSPRSLNYRVGSCKVSMGFLRERDFSRDQPCETRLLARLESRMVSWEKFAEVVGTRRVSGERHVLYLPSEGRTEQVWSRMSRETGLARRDHGLAVSSRVSSRSETQLYRSMRAA